MKSSTFNALWETRVCRTSTRHFNDDHLQDPPGHRCAPGLHGSISPSDEKKESHGTRRSEVCSSCPLRLTGAPICPGFQQRQRGPARREWNIYRARAVNSANARQCVQLPLRVWGDLYASWQSIPHLSPNIWQLFMECNCVSFIMMISQLYLPFKMIITGVLIPLGCFFY